MRRVFEFSMDDWDKVAEPLYIVYGNVKDGAVTQYNPVLNKVFVGVNDGGLVDAFKRLLDTEKVEYREWSTFPEGVGLV